MKKEGYALAKNELIASVCRERFWYFVKEFWETVVPEKPVWNWHMEFIADELQEVAERVFAGKPKKHDLIVNVPPGTSKSTLASILFPAWVWTRMNTARTLCGSYSYHLALDLSRKARDVVNSDKYKECFPEVELRPDQNTKGYFVTRQGGMRYSVGTGGSITGLHGHFLIVDDPIDPLEALSEVDIKSANTWMDETLSQRKVDKSITPLILIMQRLHQDDPTGSRLARKSSGAVRHLCFPAEITDDISPPECIDYYVRGLLDPKRLNRKVLNEARSTLGDWGFAGQMLQSPVPRGGAMFQVDNIQIVTNVPSKFRKVVRFWDKAGTAKGGAYTVGVKIGIDEAGVFWVLDVVRGQWEAFQRERMIAQTARIDGPKVQVGLEQEPGSSGKESAQNTVRNLAGFIVRPVPSTGDKETRADTFATQVNGGNVRCKDAPWTHEYIQELRYFPRGKYKDQVDASSGCFSMLIGPRIRVGVF